MQTKPTSEKSGASTSISNIEKTPEEHVETTKAELQKYDVDAVHEIKIIDPFTGKQQIVTLDRTGTTEQKLIVALADPNLTRDRKDHMLSMYMWERGKESSSFFVDLFRYKGEHTKETRAFKSQMRFDFELFVAQFSKYIREMSRLVGVTIGFDVFKERDAYKDWLKLQREHGRTEDFTYLDFIESKPHEIGTVINRAEVALMEMAILSLEEGERLVAQTQNITNARERDRGKGIYIDGKGRPYTHDDPEFDEAVKADRERRANLDNEND